MNIITLEKDTQCNNCQKSLKAGELVTAENQAVANQGGGLCTSCKPVIVPEKKPVKENKK